MNGSMTFLAGIAHQSVSYTSTFFLDVSVYIRVKTGSPRTQIMDDWNMPPLIFIQNLLKFILSSQLFFFPRNFEHVAAACGPVECRCWDLHLVVPYCQKSSSVSQYQEHQGRTCGLRKTGLAKSPPQNEHGVH